MRVLILGASGLLGRALCAEAKYRKLEVISAARASTDVLLDIADLKSLQHTLFDLSPDLVINAAADVNLANCEANPNAAFATNAAPAQILAEWSAKTDRQFVQISTDHFFDGDGRDKHDESAPVTLLNQYARSKFAAENFALQSKFSLVVRTSIVGFHPDQRGFAAWAMNSIINRKAMTLFADFYGSSIDIDTFSTAIFDLIEERSSGLLNLASCEVSSKQEFVLALAKTAQVDLNWAETGSVTALSPIRARSLGLDVNKAEKMLGRRLPNLNDVCKKLLSSWKSNL